MLGKSRFMKTLAAEINIAYKSPILRDDDIKMIHVRSNLFTTELCRAYQYDMPIHVKKDL